MNTADLDRDSGRWSPQIISLPDEMVNTFDDAREVDELLRILQESAEHDELKKAFKRLEHLFSVVPRYLEDCHVYVSILSTMTQMEKDLVLQEVGLQVLHTIMVESPVLEDKMKRKVNVFFHILRLLTDHPREHNIQAGSMRLLVRLVDSDPTRMQISHLKHWHNLLDPVMNAIKHFHQDTDLLHHSLMIVNHILKDNPDLQVYLAESYLELILLLFKNLAQHVDILKLLLCILWQAAHSDQARYILAQPVVNLVLDELTHWHSNSCIISDCFCLLQQMCLYEKFNDLLVDNQVMMRLVLPEMMSGPDEPRIQLYGLMIFLQSADSLFRHVTFDEAATQWLKVVYMAMSRHMARAEIQVYACRALTKLLTCRPEVYMWIGESSEQKQDPLHTLCLGAILMYEKNEEVFTAACLTIYYLTADNEGLCKTLMLKNSHIAIIQGLRYHATRPKAVSAACRAIRGLCIFQFEHKKEIAHYDDDLLSLLADIINSFPADPEVQSEIISTVACLSDVDVVRHQCYVLNMHLRILEAMDSFPGDEFLQEVAVEALAVLGGAADGSSILNSNGTINKVIKCMKRFLNSSEFLSHQYLEGCVAAGATFDIQKKGLCVIQILAEWHIVQSTVMCHELATIIKSTMKNYPKSLSIQKEAIVAMQILAERGVDGSKRDQYSNMAEVLVDQDCHELLFQILEKHVEDQGLHDLASECLYVLGIEQDLKSRMLRAACSKGYIAGAECLMEVGADVNIGHGTETPLYCAVSSNTESMVDFLLRHEIRDVLTSLKLSLTQGYHTITGMLLAHIGQDKETGTVQWSNLGLGDMRPEWILPTLYQQNRPHSSSLTSKLFVKKIQDGQQRRKHRLEYSHSDPGQATCRPKTFRFPTASGDHQNKSFDDIPEHHGHGHGLTRSPNTVPRMKNYRNHAEGTFFGREATTPTIAADTYHASRAETSPPAVLVEDSPLFELSEDEWEDWKRCTLTGANMPFSPDDPRRPADSKRPEIAVQKLKVKWPRKLSCRETHHPRTSCLQARTTNIGSNCVAGYQARAQPILPLDQHSSDTDVSYISRRSYVLSADDTDLDMSVDELKVNKQQEHSISSLDVSANRITSLDQLVTSKVEVLHSFAKLDHLDLSYNQLTSVPTEVFKSLTSLRILALNNNNLKEWPASIGACSKLISLDLSSNLISGLSLDSVVSLVLLELNLSKNKLAQFPLGLEKAYPHLSKLNISSNSIEVLPTVPFSLSDLCCLDISHNSFHILPDELLMNCTKLETLIAVNNGLEVLPSEYVAAGLTCLTTVKLSNNDITEKEPFYIPKFVLELPNVRVVDLSCNGIIGFPPPSMWRTQMLKELILSKNNISKLNMERARQWSKLEKLHLSYNKISELPRDIGQLSSLQSLDLSHNKQLSTLPDELGRCSRLWEMPLDGLSLDLDIKLTGGRVKDLTIYLHNRLKKAQRYYRMKLMVVGYGGRGKTSLLQALKKKIKNIQLEKPIVTVGVIVEDWRYERQRFGRMVSYTLNTWDFAGQEDFYSTHQCFLSNRTLYLVVYDISMGIDEIDKLKPWLTNIHARAPGCPVIVVGTHYDLLPEENREHIVSEFEVKLKELVHKPGFPVINCFAIVGLSRESRELEQLRCMVKDIVDEFKIKGQPVMGQKVPASYVTLGDLLHEEAKNIETSFPVIRHSQLVRLIKRKNLDLDEDDELKQAVNFLHESGVLLHYNETTLQMRDFYFINPGWLCRMMAQVVTVPQINPFIDRNGVMKRYSVQMLFTGKETSGQNNFIFPSALIPQYLHLLEKFEIALPRNEEELLIPCRLPNRKANFEMPVQDKKELVVRYYMMPNTPIGFWSRLLTRLIVFSESKFAENMLLLQERPQVQFWKEGIFVRWSQTAFFLVDSCRGSHDEIHLTVSNTAHGSRLLGYLVDHVDSLVDEWYPGLTTVDPMLGRELLEKFAPCTLCPGSQPYNFRFEDLLKASETGTDIFCPEHKGMVDLVKLAPDVMLADVEPHFHLDLEQFDFKESPENLCGDGGFGSVYKAMYKGKVVAVKVFTSIGDLHPHKMLRQEATILRRLEHPSVVALVGVSLRPVRLVVIEFAPNKSLGDVLKSGQHLSRTLQLKISQQVSEGVAYLHSLMIIYRDLKPDNVLVFSLAPNNLINAKIADYGISQFTTLFGLTSQEGTPAYRAPEVIRGETYSFQADIFSLGILMYMVVTGGTHPFDHLKCNSEIDKAFAENLPIPPVTKKGCPPWPDYQDLISQCLNQVPDYRPKAVEVFNRLSAAELFSLREVLPVSVRTTVECMTTQLLDSKNIRLWVASGDNEYMQLSWLNLLDYRDESLNPDKARRSVDNNGMGTMFRDGRVLCMLPVNKDHILLGTQAGKIWVFSAVNNELEHSSRQLQDSVLSLFLVQRSHQHQPVEPELGTEAGDEQSRLDDPLVLAGLANGKLALYPMSEILQEPTMDPIEIKLGESYEPVRCIMRSGPEHRIVASCGTKVVLMDTRRGVAVENIIDTVENSNSACAPITSMACGRLVYIAHRSSNLLETWDVARNRKKGSINISDIFQLSPKDGRITSLVLHEQKALWVGTGGGHIAVIDINNMTPVICTHRHTGSIRSLLSIKLKSTARYGPAPRTCVILSGGLGFRNRSETDTDKDNQYGCIGVWDADFPQTCKQFSDWSKKRMELLETSRRPTTAL